MLPTEQHKPSSGSEFGAVPLLDFVIAGFYSLQGYISRSCSIHCVNWTLRGTKAYRTEFPKSGIMLTTSCRSHSARALERDGARAVHMHRWTMSLMNGQGIESRLERRPAEVPGHA